MIKLVSTVGFIIFNEENKILLVKRCGDDKKEEISSEKIATLPDKEKDEMGEDLWIIPSGTLDDNDNPRDVIKREVQKCFNCQVKDCNYFNLYFYNISDSFIKKVSYFYGSIEGEIKTRDDSTSVEWVSLDINVIENLNLNPEQKTVLIEFIDFFKNKSPNNIG